MKIVYIDLFSQDNSNKFWLKAFKQYGEVLSFDCEDFQLNHTLYLNQIKAFNPNHIHFGGSVKTIQMFPLEYIQAICKLCSQAFVTAFRGDVYYNPYYDTVEKLVNKIYITNLSYSSSNKYVHTVCPTDMTFFMQDTNRNKDIVFIGNANYDERKQTMDAISQKYNIDLYGKGWEGCSQAKGPVAISDSPNVYGSYKIAIDDVREGNTCKHSNWLFCGVKNPDKKYTKPICLQLKCSKYESMQGFFSNRLTNMLLSGIMVITFRRPGIEKIFTNGKELLWVKDVSELGNVFKYYLAHDKERIKIALTGQQVALSRWTFEKVVERMIGEK